MFILFGINLMLFLDILYFNESTIYFFYLNVLFLFGYFYAKTFWESSLKIEDDFFKVVNLLYLLQLEIWLELEELQKNSLQFLIFLEFLDFKVKEYSNYFFFLYKKTFFLYEIFLLKAIIHEWLRFNLYFRKELGFFLIQRTFSTNFEKLRC
jgi:hypothetical protein